MRLQQIVADYLLEEQILFSQDEAEGIAEIVVEGDNDDENDDDTIFSTKKELLIGNLIEYLGIEDEQAKNMVQSLQRKYTGLLPTGNSSTCCYDNDSSLDGDEVISIGSSTHTDDDSSLDDDEVISIGSSTHTDDECELCDRCIQLTKHHLIPKQTWTKIKTKLLHAVDAYDKGDTEKARLIVGRGLEDVLDRVVLSDMNNRKSIIRTIFHTRTSNICRQCHSTIHQNFTNMDLALNFNTVEMLLSDTTISKFCRWVSKQKTGKLSLNYKRRH